MNDKNIIGVNPLPAPTWNWLHMNNSQAEFPAEFEPAAVSISGAAFENDDCAEWNNYPSGMGSGFSKALSAQNCGIVSAFTAENESAQARLSFDLKGGNACRRVAIKAKAGADLVVFMNYVSASDCAADLAVQTEVSAEKGAKVKLVQLQLLGKACTVFNDIVAKCEDGAELSVVQLFLGAEKTYSGCEVRLAGKKSSFTADVGYFGKETQRFDMNYNAVHTGKSTRSIMNVSGVLADSSEKLFRGTIDFKNGSAGSKGDEKEDVLLLGDDVVNKTIPLILCAEEDVQGNHGASIGRLDEALLFYLASRGIDATQAEKLMAKARLDALCAKTGDDEAQKLLEEYLEAAE